MAQEELNSFLAVAEDLKVKGLTQNNSDADKKRQNIKDTPPPSKPYLNNPTVPHNPKPPYKPPKTPGQTQMPRKTLPTIYQQDKDDIQEVVPIKSEPLPVLPDAQDTPNHYSGDVVQQAYSDNSQQQQQGIVADPNTEYEEEYVDYGEYEGMEEGYIHGNNQLVGQEGFKGELIIIYL